MCAFPGEENEWYEQQLECMKLLTHLQPPDAVFRLRYDRFSVYEQRADEYGLRLHAARAYYYIYPPQYHHIIDDIAYFWKTLKRKCRYLHKVLIKMYMNGYTVLCSDGRPGMQEFIKTV